MTEDTKSSSFLGRYAHNLPPLPDPYVERNALVQSIVKVLTPSSESEASDDSVASHVTSSSSTAGSRIVCLSGMGGNGKTVVCSASLRSSLVADYYRGRIYWISVGMAANA